MNQREVMRNIQQATFRFNQLQEQQRKADAFNAKPESERNGLMAAGLTDKEKEEVKQLQAMLQQRAMPTQTITDEQRKKAIKALISDRKIVDAPNKRNSHIQSEFYNSPEYKKLKQQLNQPNMVHGQAMYNSPYFGQFSSTVGGSWDSAYKAWAKRTGNEAIKAPPRKSPLDILDSNAITPAPRDPTDNDPPPKRIGKSGGKAWQDWKKRQDAKKEKTVIKKPPSRPPRRPPAPAGWRRDPRTGKLIQGSTRRTRRRGQTTDTKTGMGSRRQFTSTGYYGPTDRFYTYGTGPAPNFTRDNFTKQQAGIKDEGSPVSTPISIPKPKMGLGSMQGPP